RVPRQVLGAVRRHEHEVLEPHTAVALPVAAGLDGDDVAGPERLLRRQAHSRGLVNLEADAVAEPVEEALVQRLPRLFRPLRPLACRLEDLAGAVEDR